MLFIMHISPKIISFQHLSKTNIFIKIFFKSYLNKKNLTNRLNQILPIKL